MLADASRVRPRFDVWHDEYSVRLGDSLSQSIGLVRKVPNYPNSRPDARRLGSPKNVGDIADFVRGVVSTRLAALRREMAGAVGKTLKTECLRDKIPINWADARAMLFDYIETFYMIISKPSTTPNASTRRSVYLSPIKR